MTSHCTDSVKSGGRTVLPVSWWPLPQRRQLPRM